MRLAPLEIPLSSSARRLLMRPDAGPVEKRHPEPNTALLREKQQALPDTQTRPADEGLSRTRPGAKLRGNRAPLGPILMPPEDR